MSIGNLDQNVQVNKCYVLALNTLPCFAHMSDKKLIEMAQADLGSRRGIQVTDRAMAVAILVGADRLDNPKFQRS
jgi:hypothetical protein